MRDRYHAQQDFNPRPPRGGRRRFQNCCGTFFLFQSTPPARGATLSHLLQTVFGHISIHAPREGGDDGLKSLPGKFKISIHAPREGGDDKVYVPAASGIISIHAPREGGDLWSASYESKKYQISIHAPREGGDTSRITKQTIQSNFNPRPPRGGRQQRCTVLPADL